MRRFKFLSVLAVGVLVLAIGILAPAVAYAQASIAGQVTDATGAALPGVTVEAASPALLERVRTTVTSARGQYRIELMPPGTYSVTFTLPGFSTVEREGIELTGSFTATVDAELRVGPIEETITVTGETPIVDVQSGTRQHVVDRELIDALPSGRTVFAHAVLIPGVSVSAANQDVGGATSLIGTISTTIRGSTRAHNSSWNRVCRSPASPVPGGRCLPTTWPRHRRSWSIMRRRAPNRTPPAFA